MQLLADGKTFMKYVCPLCDHTCVDTVTKTEGGWTFERKYSWQITFQADKPSEEPIDRVGILKYKVNNE